MLNSLLTTVATPSKWPGRLAPQSPSETRGTLTRVWSAMPSGYISSTSGWNSRWQPAATSFSWSACRVRGYGQVFAGAELQRVDEDAGDDEVGALCGFLHQRGVAGVEVAHGRYQADALAFAASAGGAQLADGLDGDHAENPCSAAGKVTS